MRKKLSLDQSIAEIARKLKEHIGSNGNAHLPVSTDMAGFMTPELLKEHDAYFKNSTYVNDSKGTDILTLPIGNYGGYHWLNYPDSKPETINHSFSYVHVMPSSESTRRIITVVGAASGRIWVRAVNDTYEVDNSWSSIEQKELLWSGNSKLVDPVTLSAPVYNSNGSSRFYAVCVEYRTDSSNQDRRYGSRYGVIINTTNENDTEGVMAPSFYETQVEFPSSTTAVISRNRATVINTRSDGAAYLADTSNVGAVNILNIWGVR